MLAAGLVDVKSACPRVLVELKYSTTDNFMGVDMYGRLKRCYVVPRVSEMICRGQELLDSIAPGIHLKVLDGARPMSVQRMMWDSVKHDPGIKYVASPGYGSLHNYGAAVDVTLSDSAGHDLDMGTPFDDFDSLAQPRFEMYFRERGDLTGQQIENRVLLRRVMRHAGFTGILKEWWHFNAMSIDAARAQYRLIE
jgi:D-alanyl-D-alanine dipeptidase